MVILEKNIHKSFNKVKEDINNLQHQIFQLQEKVEDIKDVLLKKEKKTANESKKKKR